MKFTMQLFAMLVASLFTFNVYAQSEAEKEMIKSHLQTSAKKMGQVTDDIADYKITSFHTSTISSVTHYYLQQRHDGITIYNAHSSLHVDAEGELIVLHNQFLNNVKSRINTKKAVLDASTAISRAAQAMKYDMSELPRIKEEKSIDLSKEKTFTGGSISKKDIPVELMYQQTEDGGLHLCWDVLISETQGSDVWSMRIDATTGEILHKTNHTLYCKSKDANCPDDSHGHEYATMNQVQEQVQQSTTSSSLNAPDSYRVFSEPVESPAHGARQLVVNPADAVASPFGWHDTDGVAGAEYTITRGNNAWADDNNDFSPDGTTSLDFDFGLDFNQLPTTSPNVESAVTNLFYWANLMHDVWYQYGFDEVSGNFQFNNYGRGGIEGDDIEVVADHTTTNNASFYSPADGYRGVLRMHLWEAFKFDVNTPSGIAGSYNQETSPIGAPNYTVTGDIVIVDDGTATPTKACSPLVNSAALSGNIALIDRGNCEFGTKALQAENAGAIAAIICNNVSGRIFSMPRGSDGASVTIPTIMVSYDDCATIRAQIPGLNVTLYSAPHPLNSGFDNSAIAHEYGHGITNRLVGGAANVDCLDNVEQMGEGWSDWFGLVMTIEPGDTRNDLREFAKYVTPSDDLRNRPYTCDMNANSYTYSDISPVDIYTTGQVWATMLWEMTWDLIDEYGFDPDLHQGSGGNNIAMALVTEGLKLTPCSPGFVDARDAIILADQALYSGANECIIREAFGRRGLGDGASQGSVDVSNDGFQIFSVNCTPPPVCTGDVNLSITFDNAPSQSSWNIVDANGNIVIASGSYSDQASDSTLDLPNLTCLPDGCYDFNFYDASYGLCPPRTRSSPLTPLLIPYSFNGFVNGLPRLSGSSAQSNGPSSCGFYTLTDANGAVLVSDGGLFTFVQTNNFCISGGVANLNTPDNTNLMRQDNYSTHNIMINPSPAHEQITVSYAGTVTEEDVQVLIIDITGKIIRREVVNSGLQQLTMNISNLEAGCYFVQVISGENILIEKFIKS